MEFLRRFFLILLTFLVCNLHAIGSENSDFNKRYEEVSVSLAATNIKQAQLVADSLSTAAINDEQRIRAYMLSANLYLATGDVDDAIMNAIQANQIAITAFNTNWQAITSGFLATAFRDIGLLQASERYLTISNKANEQSPEGPMYVLTKINLLHERAFHKFKVKDYTAAESILQAARKLIVQDSKESKKGVLIKATNSQLLGHCHLHLGHLALADSMLQQTLLLIGDIESNLQPYTYRTMAEVEMQKGNLQKAYEYLNLTLPYLDAAGVQDLKFLVYQSFAKYYMIVGNLKKSNAYSVRATAIEKRKSQLANKVSDKLFEKLTTVNDDYKYRYKSVISIAICLLFGMMTLLIYQYVSKMKQKAKYSLLIEKLKKIDNIPIPNSAQPQEFIPDTEMKIKDIQISEDTEDRLLKGFIEQETARFFLEKSVCLNSLAIVLQSNQRYVSHIIRKYRGKDFYAYIQAKRIEFIVASLKKDPVLLDYKLSHLADMSGFSNPSKFSIAFKSEMGIPPSAFVHLLKNEKSSSNL